MYDRGIASLKNVVQKIKNRTQLKEIATCLNHDYRIKGLT